MPFSSADAEPIGLDMPMPRFRSVQSKATAADTRPIQLKYSAPIANFYNADPQGGGCFSKLTRWSELQPVWIARTLLDEIRIFDKNGDRSIVNRRSPDRSKGGEQYANLSGE